MGKRYLFIDFEFTMPEKQIKRSGFFPEIIEAGIVCVHGNQVMETFRAFVKPEVNPVLTERCKQFCGIEQADVDGGISFAQLVAKLSTYYEQGPVLTVTWGNMDMHVLTKQCERSQLPVPVNGEVLDLSLEHKRFYGDANQTGLMKALREYGCSTEAKHHRALDDALMTYEIFKRVEQDKQYLDQKAQTTIGDLIDVSSLWAKIG